MVATINLDTSRREIEEEIKILQKKIEEKQIVMQYLLDATKKAEAKNSHQDSSSSHMFVTRSRPIGFASGTSEPNSLIPHRPKTSFAAHVKKVIENFGSHEFSMVDVDAALDQKGVTNDSKHRRAGITNILGKLVKKNVIKRTYFGSGNIPNRYKAIDKNESIFKEVSL